MNISTRAWTLGYKLLGGLIVALTLGAIVLVSVNNAQLRAENQAMYADLQASQSNATQLYEQLLALGEDPDGEEPAEVTSTPGLQGETGAAGPRGPAGEPGPQGAEGTAGLPGLNGAAGPQGTPGTPGSAGTPGDTGPQGAQGDPGAAGPQGPQGVQGETGATGPPGPTCPDGYSLQLFTVTAIDPVTGLPYNQPAALCAPTP